KTLLENLSVKQGKKYDHPASVKDINGFIEFHNLSRDEILDPIESFKNFNEFFYRKLKPEARKLDFPNDPSILVSPADCRMMAFPTIDESIELWIKGQQFSIQRLLGDESAAKEFEGGSLGIFRLAPQDYHRFHFPVDGRIGENKPIAGDYYTVNPMAIRSELDVYGENKRSITYIDSPKFGKVAFVAVGAMMVGSIVYTSKPFSDVKRLDEHGYFAFGGSTIILLFQKGKTVFDDDILANSKQCLETL
ncbi:8888_t:CDS:2, partial [Entrophospora sp. SA101]